MKKVFHAQQNICCKLYLEWMQCICNCYLYRLWGLLSNTNVTFAGCMLLKEGHYTEQFASYLYRQCTTERRLINMLATYLIVCYRQTNKCQLLIRQYSTERQLYPCCLYRQYSTERQLYACCLYRQYSTERQYQKVFY